MLILRSMLNEALVHPISGGGFCQDLIYQYVVFCSKHDYWLAAMLSMSGEVVYKGDNFTHIGSPHIVY